MDGSSFHHLNFRTVQMTGCSLGRWIAKVNCNDSNLFKKRPNRQIRLNNFKYYAVKPFDAVVKFSLPFREWLLHDREKHYAGESPGTPSRLSYSLSPLLEAQIHVCLPIGSRSENHLVTYLSEPSWTSCCQRKWCDVELNWNHRRSISNYHVILEVVNELQRRCINTLIWHPPFAMH